MIPFLVSVTLGAAVVAPNVHSLEKIKKSLHLWKHSVLIPLQIAMNKSKSIKIGKFYEIRFPLPSDRYDIDKVAFKL